MPGIIESTTSHGAASNGNGQNGAHPALSVPVLIVGGGPTGLLTAYMLSKFGVRSLLVEKYPERLAAPKAHALSPRSLEICRQFGLDTNAMRKLGSPRGDSYWVNFLTNLSGERIGLLPYERMDKEVLDCTPEMIHNIPQPDFEKFVADALESDPNVEIRKGVAFVSCEERADEVFSTVEERSTKNRWQVKSRHVVACDGTRSQVRNFLRIESEDETMMTIHFKADLRRVVGDRVGMLHWITDPACSGFVIAYDLGGNQVLISNFDSKRHPAETWTQDLARSTVSAAVGKDIPLEILSYRPWLLSRKVAREYRHGRVFLVGDAAHSFPPTGGLGLNSGLADAHNLAYKIAAVHQGWAKSSLLDSYEDDRRQIAIVNSAQSVKNGKKIFSFLKTLGTAGIDDVEQARANLHRSIHDPAKQGMIEREVEGQREHFDNLGIHIGYVYGDKETPTSASSFTPKFVTGARLPHAWIKLRGSTAALDLPPVDVSYVSEFTKDDIAARKYSTLDLVDMDNFTLIVSSKAAWAERFQQLQDALDEINGQLQLRAMDADFEFVDAKQLELFEEGAHFSEGGALLVRPDQHLLGCPGPQTSARDLESLIRSHLGL
ncbi:FAD binding domain-containing protein [Emericellopsis cladophorae]|uniref:FAD binding domain-containing protein n=1 Tax=Emericellopsis cladophorae TaxID=2686198 RepID=A0A9P9XYN3_9HYPO|nr:FAD binding domain-containing protein [Emericellopsis cladophorae]KAI6780267.1 FAD binding domain-containing protein [Emericellopsis cladophorae]